MLTVHNTGIPLDTHVEAFEYTLPLPHVHQSCDDRWRDWAASLVGWNSEQIHVAIAGRFELALAEFEPLVRRIRPYRPFAILFYGGMPYVWAARQNNKHPDSIYIPPTTPVNDIDKAVDSFDGVLRKKLVNFFAVFGGIGERYPWEAVEFDRHGKSDNNLVRLLMGDDATEWVVDRDGMVQHYDHGTKWNDSALRDIDQFVVTFSNNYDADFFDFAYHQ